MSRPTAALLGGLLTLALATTACTDNAASSEAAEKGSGRLSVTSTDRECQISSVSAPSGSLVFTVENKGSKITEFYLLGEDGLRIVGEVENIGPGITRDLVVQAKAGSYTTVCKPGMVGKGIRAPFEVTESGNDLAASGDTKELIDTATGQYAAYVRDQTEQLVVATKEFADLYKTGEDDKARAAYAPARVHWERIEPVAESFGDLDPRLDLREADLAEGQKWTGWHRIEKDLWPPTADSTYKVATTTERRSLADQLLADTEDLHARVAKLTYTADQLGNGAKELLDEVANGKVTGEEEIWSHTDLWDFQANVDGARIAFENLKPVIDLKDPALAKTLVSKFGALQKLLDKHRKGDGFVLYTTLSDAQVKELADAVNALGEPLSKLTATVVL